LLDDLQALGCTPSLERLPMCAQLPVIDSSAACLGVLYVLEGATLGGQILRRKSLRGWPGRRQRRGIPRRLRRCHRPPLARFH
jgi:heme oxygenase